MKKNQTKQRFEDGHDLTLQAFSKNVGSGILGVESLLEVSCHRHSTQDCVD
jgi:hypothetical protein